MFMGISFVLVPGLRIIISQYFKTDLNQDRSNNLSGIVLFLLISVFITPALYFATYKSLNSLFAYITSSDIQAFFESARGVWSYKKILSKPLNIFAVPFMQVVAYGISFYTVRNFAFLINKKSKATVFNERDVFIFSWLMTISVSVADVVFFTQSFAITGAFFHNLYNVFSRASLLIIWVLFIHITSLANNGYLQHIKDCTKPSKIDNMIIFNKKRMFASVFIISFLLNMPFVFGLQFSSGNLIMGAIVVVMLSLVIYKLRSYTKAFLIIGFGEGEGEPVSNDSGLFVKKTGLKMFDGNRVKTILFLALFLLFIIFTAKGLVLISYFSLIYLVFVLLIWVIAAIMIQTVGIIKSKRYKVNLSPLRLFVPQLVRASVVQIAIIGVFFVLMTVFPKNLSTENYYKETAITCFVDSDGNYLSVNYNDTFNCISVHNVDELPVNFKKFLFLIEDRAFQNQDRIIPAGINPAKITNWHGVSLSTVGGMFIGRGGSNLNMQLSKNYMFWGKSTPKDIQRKLIELFSAYQISMKYDSDEILKYYCDIASFNAGVGGMQGVNSTSLFSFGRPLNQLNNLELLYLTQTLKGDSIRISDSKRVACKDAPQHRVDIKSRLLIIAKNWMKNGLIESDLYNDLSSCSLNFTYERFRPDINLTTRVFLQKFKESKSEGLIYTSSINLKNQKKMETGYSNFEKEFDKFLKIGNVNLCVSALVVDVKTGKIIGHLSRGSDTELTIFGEGFGIASLIKPFICLKLIEYTKDLFVELSNGLHMLSIEDVIIRSSTEAIDNIGQVSDQIQIYKNVEESFNEMGIKQDTNYNFNNEKLDTDDSDFKFRYSYGHRCITLFDIAQAYQTLFNKGEYIKLTPITEIYSPITRERRVVQEPKKQIYNPALTEYITECMKGVINDKRGTAYGLKNIVKNSENLMAKTGTANNNEHGYIVISDGDILIATHITYGKDVEGIFKIGLYPIPYGSGGKSAGVLAAYIYNEFCD